MGINTPGKAIKNLNLKNLHSDDIGKLKQTRASEFGTLVRCHNHAQSVNVRRAVDQWYKEQNIAVTRLSRGQQKVYRSLLKFHQIKRDIKRKEHIKHQIEIQEKLRENVVKKRIEIEIRENKDKQTEKDKKKREFARQELRKEKSFLRSKYHVLPGIGEEGERKREKKDGESVSTLTGKSNSRGAFTDKTELKTPATRESLLTTNDSHGLTRSPQNICHDNSFILRILPTPIKMQTNSEKEHTLLGLRHIPSRTEELIVHSEISSSLSFIEAVDEANYTSLLSRNNSYARMKLSSPYFTRNVAHSRPKDRDGHTTSRKDSEVGSLTDEAGCMPVGICTTYTTLSATRKLNLNTHKVLPSITKKNTDQRTRDGTDAEEVHGRAGNNQKSGHPTGRRRRSSDVNMSTRDSLLDDNMNKYHVGILNRTFKLPNYKAPQVDYVIKYTKNSNGSLVPSEQAVQPASHEFKIPSNKKAYMIRKALEFEKANEGTREKKLQEFFGKMSDMERGSRETDSQSKMLCSRKEAFRHHTSDDYTHGALNSMYAYILGTAQGDVTDIKNCRYIRTKDDDHRLQRRGKLSSWGNSVIR